MLSYRDCVDMSSLDDDEIDVIAEYAGIPRLSALCIGECLIRTALGTALFHQMLKDVAANAKQLNNTERIKGVRAALLKFHTRHPKYRRLGR